MRRIYLDHAATTPVHPQVAEVMAPYFSKDFGNPSTLYSYGREAKGALEEARAKVARLIGAKQPEEIVFTSGGTEADNFALCGIAWANQKKGNHIITSSIEHHAVINVCKFLEKRGFKVTYLPVDKEGLVDPQEVEKTITEGTILVSIMHANNEIGTVEPIEEIAKIVKEKGIYFHTDAVQTLGHLPINVDKMRVDLLAMSAHKLYGPKGVGALYIKKGTKIVPFLYGGEQENKRRASTENVAGIVGFGEACSLAQKDMAEEEKRLVYLRDKLIEGILKRIKHSRLNGHPEKRLPGNVNVSLEGVEGESMLLQLDLAGVCASSGSACTSSILEPSHVLTAIGISPEVAHSSLRFTLGKENNEEDINYVLKVLPGIVEKLRSMSPIYHEEK
ncbi:cysteine desulfurase NifS [bacterium]|nr:cysteine desulfurase NifS [bacterium]NIN91769.1 cysteine desulfurase NifS [bacterium]NIO73038.1 cysteine desulfurase NifS [bacterium]